VIPHRGAYSSPLSCSSCEITLLDSSLRSRMTKGVFRNVGSCGISLFRRHQGTALQGLRSFAVGAVINRPQKGRYTRFALAIYLHCKCEIKTKQETAGVSLFARLKAALYLALRPNIHGACRAGACSCRFAMQKLFYARYLSRLINRPPTTVRFWKW